MRHIDLTGLDFGDIHVVRKSEEKVNNKLVWICVCGRCGREFTLTTNQLKTRKNQNCGCFRGEDLTNKKFGRLTPLYPLEQRSKSKGIIWHCRCDCGNECDTEGRNLKSGETRSCGCLAIETKRELGRKSKIDLTGRQFGFLKVIKDSGERRNENVMWECECSNCGTIVLMRASSLLHGEAISCGCIKSKGELKISQILTDNNIPFVKQKTFETCKFENNRKALFDFYVDDKYIIEYDGEQHFYPRETGSWNTKEVFEKNLKHDLFKNQWCIDNNIPLIRIPFTHLSQIKLKDLLLETTDFLI